MDVNQRLGRGLLGKKKIKIRSERVEDYPHIAEINILAFFRDGYIDEMTLVDVQRHGPNFDPELSLVAELEGKIIGYALFYPHKIFIDGIELNAASLAPICVHPSFQRQGVGSMLMNEGHRRLQEKGYTFSFLLGHISYYPSFGYRTHMLATCFLEIDRKNIPDQNGEIIERQVEPSDIEQLVSMWKDWFMDVDFAIFPGSSIVEWISHSKSIRTSVIWMDGKIKGFLRYHIHRLEVSLFLAKDRSSTFRLLGYLHQKIGDRDIQYLQIPLHPDAKAVKKWIAPPYTVRLNTLGPAMIKILDTKNQTINTYCGEVISGKRKPGMLIFPAFFEII